MAAFGADIVLTPKAGGRRRSTSPERMQARDEGCILDQFANPDNPLAHYRGTRPAIWRDGPSLPQWTSL